MPSPATIILSLIIAAVFVAIVARGIHNKRQGKSSCACGDACGHCASAGMCHPKKK